MQHTKHLAHPTTTFIVAFTALATLGSMRAHAEVRATAPVESEIRYERLVFAMGGHEVGTSEARDVALPDGYRFERTSKISVKRGSSHIEMNTKTIAVTSKDMTPVHYRFEKRDAAGLFVLEGKREGKNFVIRSAGNNTPPIEIAIDDRLTFASAMDVIIRQNLKDKVRLQRRVIVEEMGAVKEFESTIAANAAGGFTVRSTLAGLDIVDEIDREGRTLVSRTPALAAVAYPVGAPPPDGVSTGEIDVLARSTWPAPRLNGKKTRVVYRITTPEPARFHVPEDERQHVLRRTATTIDVEVRDVPSSTRPLDAKTRAHMLSSTAYEAVGEPRLKAAALKAIGDAKTDDEKVARLVRFVFNHVEAKSLDRGYAPALVTLDSKEGDCTEHSVLLSALLRAVGIPTRLVDGVVVDGGRSGYHEWVEAYIDGRGLTPVDPTFGESPASPARLKLAEGNSSPEGLLDLGIAAGRMLRPGVKIEVVETTPAQ